MYKLVFCLNLLNNNQILSLTEMVKSIILFAMITLTLTPITSVFAEDPIMITKSTKMVEVTFDGIWTHGTEWKKSSLNSRVVDGQEIFHMRTAHQGNFVYVFLDVVIDKHLDKGSDKSVICFDTENDKTEFVDSNDYCFTAILGENVGSTLQGESSLVANNFQNIPNAEGFIGIGAVSDENDRYSIIPHTSYEFRIPTDLIGRSDNYGFYVGIYDDFTKTTYSWPIEIVLDEFKIPSPKLWGEIISPDKSLPEFEWAIMAMLPAFILVIFITKLKKYAYN